MTLQQLLYEAYGSGRDVGFAIGVRRGKERPDVFTSDVVEQLSQAGRAREEAYGESRKEVLGE